MDDQAELRSFLTTRRARITPEEAGILPFPGLRRVPGLRREEVAYIAGISVDYYTRLERGRVAGVSEDIIDAVSRALRLNGVEHDHLISLFQALRPATPRAARPRPTSPKAVDVTLQRAVDSIVAPAFVQNTRLDLLAANRIGWKLFPHAEQSVSRAAGRPFNLMRYQLLDSRAQDFYLDWELAVRNGVALLRDAAARDRDDKELFTLIGELSAKSEFFRAQWASHDVLRYRRGPKRYRHPLVGDVAFESLSFSIADTGNDLLIYTIDPDSPTSDAMRILETWTADTDSDRVVPLESD